MYSIPRCYRCYMLQNIQAHPHTQHQHAVPPWYTPRPRLHTPPPGQKAQRTPPAMRRAASCRPCPLDLPPHLELVVRGRPRARERHSGAVAVAGTVVVSARALLLGVGGQCVASSFKRRPGSLSYSLRPGNVEHRIALRLFLRGGGGPLCGLSARLCSS